MENGKKGHDAAALDPEFRRWAERFEQAGRNTATPAMQLFLSGCTFAFNLCAITARELTFPSVPTEEINFAKLDVIVESFLLMAKTVAGGAPEKKVVEVKEGEIPKNPFDVLGSIPEASQEQLESLVED